MVPLEPRLRLGQTTVIQSAINSLNFNKNKSLSSHKIIAKGEFGYIMCQKQRII